MGYSRVEVVTSQNKLGDLKEALSKIGVSGMTVLQAMGCGVEHGKQEYEVEEKKIMELLPKQMIIIVVEDEKVEKLLEIIKKVLYTGHIGDGKIFVSDVTKICRVRTGEEDMDALY